MNIQRNNPVSAAKPVQAVQAPAKKADARDVASNASETAVPSKAEPTPVDTNPSRLEAFSKKIEGRFESALSSNNLTPRQQQALEKERDRFHSMLARFEASYMDGAEGAKMDKADGMQKLLANFAKSVNHIVAGNDAAQPTDARVAKPTDITRRGSGSSRGGIDIVG